MSDIGTNYLEIFPWHKNFEVGIYCIDEQHKKLVAILNKLAVHVSCQSNSTFLKQCFNELLDYTDYHFKFEEKIWNAYFADDEWGMEHDKTHQSFVAELIALGGANQENITQKLVSFLSKWLVHHILNLDNRMAIAVCVMESGCSLEEAKVRSTNEMNSVRKVMIETVLAMYEKLSVRTMSIMHEQVLRKEAEGSLLKAKKEAEAANRAKSVFLANMSHDILTPMGGILGMTNLALNTELTSEQQKYIESIRLLGDGLLSLLNNILDLSKIEAGQLLMEEDDFNLPAMLTNTIAMVAVSAEEKGLELNLQYDASTLPVFVCGDELRLRQILLNLLDNAIKFTDQGSVTLKVVADERDVAQHTLHFTVIDTGIGISADKYESILSMFSQADASATRKFAGSGLGLSISSQLAEIMAGKLWIENNQDQGAIFHVSVVLTPSRVSMPSLQHENVVTSRLKELDILLVDDSQINCEIAQVVLERDGHCVVTAPNGLVALGLLANRNFDLILMDVQMPVMDGLTASIIIRTSENGGDLAEFDLPLTLSEKLIKQRQGKHIPIVAMTANAMEGDKEECFAAGMDHYLTKPFQPDQLRATIVTEVFP